MGRIVYFSLPAHGHINPTLAVIRELVRREQQVVYYSTEQFRQFIRDTGAQFRPSSTEFCMPEQGPGPFAQVSTTLETLLGFSRAILDHHLEQVRMLRPTHIMYDSFTPWGDLLRKSCGSPPWPPSPAFWSTAISMRTMGPIRGRSPDRTP